jgi:hypothetical protein
MCLVNRVDRQGNCDRKIRARVWYQKKTGEKVYLILVNKDEKFCLSREASRAGIKYQGVVIRNRTNVANDDSIVMIALSLIWCTVGDVYSETLSDLVFQDRLSLHVLRHV